MRRLIITRGAQGSGKSTAIGALGLDPWVVSADRIRQVIAGPVVTLSGAFGVPQAHDARVWSELFANLEERMGRGELVVVDATHPNARAFKNYRDLARTHRYEVLCLDMSSVPLERCLAQNASRAAHRVVPDKVLRDTWDACQRGQVPQDVARVLWSEDGAHEAAVRAFLDVPIVDLSSYSSVLHIGDLQGCAVSAKTLLGDLDDDVFYAFVGDFCDRGPENDAALRLVLDIMDRPNVALLWGNHEEHLHRWAKGLASKSDEFTLRTLPQLEAAGIRPEDADTLCDRLLDVLLYRYDDTHVMVCHAGMPSVPERPELVSSSQWSRGVGYYSSPIDAIFSDRAPEGWLQVHGHRNIADLPLVASARSFNLEGKVEFGGHLRAMRLDCDGTHAIEVRNSVFRPIQEVITNGALRDKKMYPAWVSADMPAAAHMDPGVLAKLRAHDLVRERPSEIKPWIASFNFTRDAFYDAKWDELNVTARGLFVDVERDLIVVRSYDKFFNVGERPETQLSALEQNLVFPVTAWVKDNGYLGLAGYDAHEDAIVWASKATLGGDFAGWLREIAHQTLDEGKLDKLRRFLRDTQSSMVFEVIDPVRDPHMIDYEAPKLVLLDVVRRAQKFERMSYVGLQHVGKRFGLEVKRKGATFKNWRALSGFLEAAMAPDYTWQGEQLEGFVFEDASGFQTKLKLDFYSFWKRMRGLKERVRKVRGTNKALGRDVSEPRVAAFYEWAMRQPDEVLARDIIALRELFLAGVDAQWDAPAPKVDSAVLGFERALEGLADSVSEGVEIKTKTADALLGKALAHDGMMSVLTGSNLKIGLLLAASEGDARRDAADQLGIDLDGAGNPI